ncbi:ricin-type beta-trefoil lectin domain protein [Nonomuraea sp. NPDC049480]|uniref:ricin-type beta-trefoil lectin domain protein n=1 Tax=Nonomuraea sp. NPDC049480 TaxID=3364353 RepID=UPI00378E7055
MAALTRGLVPRAIAAAVLLASPLIAVLAQPAVAHTRGTSEFRGVNWADPRDNYAADAVVPSGLSTSDGYSATHVKAKRIVSGFRSVLGANTVRMPINPSSVGTTWWSSYTGAIDAALGRGMKVILSYWEANTSKDGKIDDMAAWNAMWDTVVRKYGRHPGVYFEPMNEPFGYSLDQWVAINSEWLAAHRQVPRGRLIVSGTGYNDNVTGVGAAPELQGTLLSLHFYGFWASHTTEAEWKANLAPRIGEYAHRTLIDEAGAPMTTGLNYGAWNGNIYTSYFAAVTNTARDNRMGLVYWPGLRAGDAYSLLSQNADGSLAPNSATGLAQLRWGWGIGDEPPVNDDPPAPPGEVIRGVGSDRCVDVPGWSTTNGTQLDLWDCNDGANQSWNHAADGRFMVYGNKCMEIGGDGVSPGSPVQINDCAGTPAQKWAINADLTITNPATGLCLQAAGAGTGNGTLIDVGTCNGTAGQQWKRS